jgi:hypothetical protein
MFILYDMTENRGQILKMGSLDAAHLDRAATFYEGIAGRRTVAGFEGHNGCKAKKAIELLTGTAQLYAQPHSKTKQGKKGCVFHFRKGDKNTNKTKIKKEVALLWQEQRLEEQKRFSQDKHKGIGGAVMGSE